MPSSIKTSSAQKILTASEFLFATHGYSAVSLRQITAAAGVNLAAVNYHFYDKESLWKAIITQRLQQVNQLRLALLEEAEAKQEAKPLPLPEILHALARPLLVPDKELGNAGARLVGRLLSERQSFADNLIRAEFQPMMNHFGQALRRHAPRLPPSDFLWRLSFVTGALHHAAVTFPDMPFYTDGLCQSKDRENALANFVTFAARAFSSSSS